MLAKFPGSCDSSCLGRLPLPQAISRTRFGMLCHHTCCKWSSSSNAIFVGSNNHMCRRPQSFNCLTAGGSTLCSGGCSLSEHGRGLVNHWRSLEYPCFNGRHRVSPAPGSFGGQPESRTRNCPSKRVQDSAVTALHNFSTVLPTRTQADGRAIQSMRTKLVAGDKFAQVAMINGEFSNNGSGLREGTPTAWGEAPLNVILRCRVPGKELAVMDPIATHDPPDCRTLRIWGFTVSEGIRIPRMSNLSKPDMQEQST